MKPKDWYTPSGDGKLRNVTPVAFTYKEKRYVAAPGPDGSFVLLDGESLAAPITHTPLSQTTKSRPSKSRPPKCPARSPAA